MKKKVRNNAKSPHNSMLEPGDNVKYTLNTADESVQRTGKILLMDGSWCVVRLRSKKWVWVSLRGA